MKHLLAAMVAFSSTSVFASAPETIAFERLSYEISSASTADQKVESTLAYFGSLDRLDQKPASSEKCLLSAFSGQLSNIACGAVSAAIREGGGTGGVD